MSKFTNWLQSIKQWGGNRVFILFIAFLPFLMAVLAIAGLLLYANPETSDKMLYKTKTLISTITNAILKLFSKKHRRRLRALNTIKALRASSCAHGDTIRTCGFQYVEEDLVLKFGNTFITMAEMLLLTEKSFYEMSPNARFLNKPAFDRTLHNLKFAMKEEYSRMEDAQAEVDNLEAQANMHVLIKANELANALLVKK
jgi:hypothetical protein